MKILIPLLFTLLFGQQLSAQFHYGFKVGYSNSTAKYSPAKTVKVKNISTFQAGVLSELRIKNFLISSNLLFNQKGNFGDNSEYIIDAGQAVTFRLNYLELNLLPAYRFKIGANTGIAIGAGLYIAVGLSGTEKGNASSIGGSFKVDRKVRFSNEEQSSENKSYFKPIDAGLDLNFSAKFKKYLFYLNYSYGLNNRANHDFYSAESRNRVFSVGVGYFLK